MLKFLKDIIDLIYKKRCYFCKVTNNNERMCLRCYKKIVFFNSNFRQVIDGSRVFCATFYKDNTKKLIRAVKYHNEKDLVYYQAKLMCDYWNTLPIKNEKFIVVPVPMYKTRQKKRKYNHMDLVAEAFVNLIGENLVLDTKLITRIKDTKPQYKLTFDERQKNLKDAFLLSNNFEKYKDKKILIVDDIFTTGSTLQEMIKTFHAKGIEDITCYTTSCSEFYN